MNTVHWEKARPSCQFWMIYSLASYRQHSVFFCKEMFVAVPKAWSVRGMKALPDTSNYLETGNLPYFGMCLFHFWLGVSPDTSRLTIPSWLGFSPSALPFTPHGSLVSFRVVGVRGPCAPCDWRNSAQKGWPYARVSLVKEQN